MIDFEKERIEFEKHASKFFRTNEAFEVKNDSYVYDEIIFMWDCWIYRAKQEQAKIDAVLALIETTQSNENTALSDNKFLKSKIEEILK